MSFNCYDIQSALEEHLVARYHDLPPLQSKEDVKRVLPRPWAYFPEKVSSEDSLLNDVDKLRSAILFTAPDALLRCTFLPVSDMKHSRRGKGDMILWLEEYGRDGTPYANLHVNEYMKWDHRLDKCYYNWHHPDAPFSLPIQGLRGRVLYEMSDSCRDRIIDECWARTSAIIALHQEKRHRVE